MPIPSTEEQRVFAAEDEYVAGEISPDEAALRRIVDDRFVFNRIDGTTTGKEALIQSVHTMEMTGQTIRERSLLMEGDTALVFGTAELQTTNAEGQESVTALRYTAAYVQGSGSWYLIALLMQPRATK